jgi:hypothetical protein
VCLGPSAPPAKVIDLSSYTTSQVKFGEIQEPKVAVDNETAIGIVYEVLINKVKIEEKPTVIELPLHVVLKDDAIVKKQVVKPEAPKKPVVKPEVPKRVETPVEEPKRVVESDVETNVEPTVEPKKQVEKPSEPVKPKKPVEISASFQTQVNEYHDSLELLLSGLLSEMQETPEPFDELGLST